MTTLAQTKKTGNIRAQSQHKILIAASTEFVLQGYKGATVQSIADRAELPKANILYYFKNKENIYQAVLEHTLEMWDEGIGDIDPSEGPKAAIEKFIDAKVRMSFNYPEASKIYAMEIIQGAQHLKEFARTYQRKWVREKAKLFQQWIDNGEMANVDPVHLIFLIWSSTQHYADFETQILTIMNRADYEEDDVETVINFLTDLILRGCGLK
ncbi:MAG: TetR/AcrR family transcriptional regulator [Psychrosphaera sp.]|jgi:TetR/AcrR family transcriptional regulator|uniref:TetR/AcrR family transcriptional regulator n=1 Tax=Psychrosphaera aquimarina TaxID=2044854 RepID=A0ABU3QX42_9GAMM|nr:MULTISPECIES: TetR/AcrR family transcriptional regulator [Psychrosphaera]MBU2919472.1 TetR/AcrR family transcriptional regulator [Psychrosphaera sp. F3M07]MDU0112007.1 TetR/AcrR family transcriptional regulator [Psychrosphaera aquimarina]